MSSDSVAPHDYEKTVAFSEEIPKHEPRGEFNDSFYQSEREVALDHADGCWICGRTEDDLKDADGYGQYLEAHHWAVEWSLWNACDPDLIQSLFDSLFIDFYGFCEDKEGEEVTHPGDRRNLVVLCPRHHRYSPDPDKGGGVHNLTFPVWVSQRSMKDGYILFDNDS